MTSLEAVPAQPAHRPIHNPRPRPRYRGPRGGGHTQELHGQSPEQALTELDLAGHSSDRALAFRSASDAPRLQPQSSEHSDAEHPVREKKSSVRHDTARRQAPRNATRVHTVVREATQARVSAAAQAPNFPNTTADFPRGGRRGRRGHGAGFTSRSVTSHGSERHFGGRLTTALEGAQEVPAIERYGLQPDAPEFMPGQQHQSRPPRVRRGNAASAIPQSAQDPAQRRRRDSKSSAADIATRTHEDIANGVYECPICTSEVARSSKVWSCKTCWTVFHLSCINKWSENEGSTLTQQQLPNGDMPPPRQWRCPGCNLPKSTIPSIYYCWCEKEIDPRPISGLPPHSCGQTCGKSRLMPKKCPHPCELLCHAGPCPPCSHLGPVQSCFCGKKSTSRRCVDTNYDIGWSCEEVCGDLMPCGEHICERPCHEGLCGACEVRVDGRCYCGKVSKPVICYERGNEKESMTTVYDNEENSSVESWNGTFDCGSSCDRAFDCGKHLCELQCHSQEADPSHCPRSPDVVSRCPCGKTELSSIIETPRQTCDDPIPSCQKECTKKLSCGHFCQQVCHSGPCMPCLRAVNISCRCGRTTCPTICHQGTEEPPQCMRTCKVTLNCGRHECGEHCCMGERKATERQALKRKLRHLGATPRLDDGFETEHICFRLCGRTLKCGNHPCPELCHKGPCGSCREAIFDEISCYCGRTVLQPPLPCGTAPPPCRFECERPKNCGHPQIPHNCHGNGESCPKCPFLVEKPCMCGKKALKNQPCWLADVRCGEICDRKLRCGSHLCRKPCHRPGECEDAGKSCQQLCGKAKKFCSHSCEELCHAPSSCREDKPCQSKMLATCDCQHLKQETRCNASRSGDGNSKKKLKCDDECLRLERNRKLALALNVDPEAHKDDHVPYSNQTLQFFQQSTKWAQTQERELRVFAADDNEKRLRFKPMPAHQRAFLHSLAEDFGLDSESVDPEPHRHVFVFKTPRFLMAPMKTLAECVRIRSLETATATSIEAQRRVHAANNDPFNGFLLTGPRFGLTLDDLHVDLSSAFATASSLVFEISFLPSEEIVLKARPASTATATSPAVEPLLRALKPALADLIAQKHLAASIYLCVLDSSLNILRKEQDSAANADGWSQVVAKGSVGARFAERTVAVGNKSAFTVLGSKVRDKKKKEEEKRRDESIVDDWEEEFRREEEAEKDKVDGEEEGLVAEDGDGDGGEEATLDVDSAVHSGGVNALSDATDPAIGAEN